MSDLDNLRERVERLESCMAEMLPFLQEIDKMVVEASRRTESMNDSMMLILQQLKAMGARKGTKS